MKKLLIAFLLLSTIFTISCSKDSDKGNATLSLSEENTITVPSSATEKIVTVTTDYSDWKYYATATWLTIAKSENKLTISISKNNDVKSRQADIMVFAGNVSKKLTINQAAAEIQIITSNDKLEVTNAGGTFQIELNTNSNNWTAECNNSEWLKLTPKTEEDALIVEVDENNNPTERKTTITIKDVSGASSEISVIQEAGLYYILPLLKPDATMADIESFETARRSSIIFDEEYLTNQTNPTYNTKSSAFTKIQYTFSGEYLTLIDLLASSASIINDDYFQFLKDNGFNVSEENNETYVKTIKDSKNAEYSATVSILTSNIVRFEIIPLQPGSMETFSIIPYNYIRLKSYTEFANAEPQKIMNFEVAFRNGVYNDKESGIRNEKRYMHFEYELNSDEYSRVASVYILNVSGGLRETYQCFTDVSKFGYQAAGKFLLSKEFKKLLEDNGYYPYGMVQGFYRYFNSETKILLYVTLARYSNVNNGSTIIDLRFVDGSKFSPTSSSNIIDDTLQPFPQL